MHLRDFNALSDFLHTVPRPHCRYIRSLELNATVSHGDHISILDVTSAVVELLTACFYIKTLSITMEGSLDASLIPCFDQLHQLEELSLTNSAEEDTLPL